jgi:hypothetical protein
MPRRFRLPGSLMRRPPGLGPGASSFWTRKGRGAPLLETSRYGRMVSSRSLAAAYRPGGRGYAHGQTGRGKRGPQQCESPLPRDQDSFADVIPAARGSVGLIGWNVNTGTSAGVLPESYTQTGVEDAEQTPCGPGD